LHSKTIAKTYPTKPTGVKERPRNLHGLSSQLRAYNAVTLIHHSQRYFNLIDEERFAIISARRDGLGALYPSQEFP
jgi:hypothetical protein